MSSFIDTGLGWGAWDSSLMSVAGFMGYISGLSGEGFTGQPIPKNLETATDVLAAGFHMSSVAANNREYYIACTGDEDVLCFHYPFPNNPARHYMVLVTNTSGATVRRVEYNTTTGSVQTTNTVRITTQDATTGLYYYQQNWGEDFSGAGEWYVPMFSTRDSGLAAIQYINRAFYKLNPGYACCAFARWIDIEGNVITAPTIISSNPDYAVIGSSDTTPDSSQTSFGVRHQGMSFTVSLVAGLQGEVDTATVPFADFTTALPYPISAATLAEALITYHNIRVLNAPDPYGGPTSDGGGGDGEDQNGDDVPFSVPPNLSAVGSGFLTLFVPTLAEIQQVAGWMWSTGFDTETAKKIFLNPIDSVLGLHIVPCATVTDGNKEIKIAGVGSGYSANYTTHQYMPVDCGSVAIPKKWGSYLDYAPYTKTQIFLPYIGFRDIDIDDIQGKTVSLMYLIDILSGACNAELRVPTDDGNNAVLYSWAGQCAAQIPITSGDLRGAISGAVSVAASVGAAVISGGATAAIGAGANVAYNMLSQKAHVQRSGSVSGAGGFIAGQQAYIVRSQPNIALPAEQNKFSGYPSFVTVTLGSIAGYNEVDSIHLENIPATNSELDEIETLLKGGVIL